MSDSTPSRFAQHVLERQEALEADLANVESCCNWRVDEEDGSATVEWLHELKRAEIIELGFSDTPGPVLSIGPASGAALQVASDGLMEESEYWFVTMVGN